MNRPRPVLTTSSIVGAVTGVAAVLAFLGYADTANDISGEAQGIAGAVVFLVPFLSHLYAGFKSQTQVTPIASPQDASGMPLIPAHLSVPVPEYVKVDAEAPAAPAAPDSVIDADAALAEAESTYPLVTGTLAPRPSPTP